MRKWRIPGLSGGLALACRQDVRADQARFPAPPELMAEFDTMIADPIARQTLLDIVQTLGRGLGFSGKALSPRDLRVTLRSRLYEAFRQGELCVVSSPKMHGFSRDVEGASPATAEPPPAAPAQTPRPPARVKTHWIEFRVVDETGQPIEGVELIVKLPDGRQESHITNSAGYVEINDILAGACEVRCNLEGAALPNTSNFIKNEQR